MIGQPDRLADGWETHYGRFPNGVACRGDADRVLAQWGSWITEPQAFYNESLAVFALAMLIAVELVERSATGDSAVLNSLALRRVGRGLSSQDFLTDAGIDVSKPSLSRAMFARIDVRLRQSQRENAMPSGSPTANHIGIQPLRTTVVGGFGSGLFELRRTSPIR